MISSYHQELHGSTFSRRARSSARTKIFRGGPNFSDILFPPDQNFRRTKIIVTGPKVTVTMTLIFPKRLSYTCIVRVLVDLVMKVISKDEQ